jgi:glycosyltransferase involved in cell wall biosynthesis
MREVGGEGALYHEGTRHEELAVLLEKVSSSAETRASLIDAGFKNAARFTWEAHIRTLTSVYQEIAAAPGRA